MMLNFLSLCGAKLGLILYGILGTFFCLRFLVFLRNLSITFFVRLKSHLHVLHEFFVFFLFRTISHAAIFRFFQIIGQKIFLFSGIWAFVRWIKISGCCNCLIFFLQHFLNIILEAWKLIFHGGEKAFIFAAHVDSGAQDWLHSLSLGFTGSGYLFDWVRVPLGW